MSYRQNKLRIPDSMRREVLQRDPVCVLRVPDVCTGGATEVDHRVPDSAGGATDMANLQGVCAACHAVKSEGERKAAIRHRVARRRLPRGEHPSKAF